MDVQSHVTVYNQSEFNFQCIVATLGMLIFVHDTGSFTNFKTSKDYSKSWPTLSYNQVAILFGPWLTYW